MDTHSIELLTASSKSECEWRMPFNLRIRRSSLSRDFKSRNSFWIFSSTGIKPRRTGRPCESRSIFVGADVSIEIGNIGDRFSSVDVCKHTRTTNNRFTKVDHSMRVHSKCLPKSNCFVCSALRCQQRKCYCGRQRPLHLPRASQ